MTYSYYPGCTLKTKAAELDRYGRECAAVLGIELQEIDDWQCCGAVYPLARDEIAVRLSAVRALTAARDKGQKLVTLCSACHHVLTRVNNDMAVNEDIRTKANNYLAPEEPYAGETQVIHYLQLLRDEVGFDNLKKAVSNPLTGRKIGAYYGCLLLRPSKVMAFDDPENPTIIEDFIKALGATPVVYPMRNECCTAYASLRSGEASDGQVAKIIANAKYNGAEELITACPLCMYNLSAHAPADTVPVKYITELLAEALGIAGYGGEGAEGADWAAENTGISSACCAGLKD